MSVVIKDRTTELIDEAYRLKSELINELKHLQIIELTRENSKINTIIKELRAVARDFTEELNLK